MKEELSQRSRLVLEAVVASYIDSAEPVGSRTISKIETIGLSPATIRNVMADLEESGYLSQPHVSAGRLPTAKGLRFYVDSLLEVDELDQHVKREIYRTVASEIPLEPEKVLQAASRALSGFSRHAGVVAAPTMDQEMFRHMEFVLLHPGAILVVLVSQGGQVQNRVIECEERVNQETLDKHSRYLNDLLSNLTLSQVKTAIIKEMAQEKARFDRAINSALSLAHAAFAGDTPGKVYINGRSNLMDAPEFADIQRLKAIFDAFEEKSDLLRLLEKSMAAKGVKIFIGRESNLFEMEGLTAVTASYGAANQPLGALGVIGPTRMDYARVIPVVDFTARLISQVLDWPWPQGNLKHQHGE